MGKPGGHRGPGPQELNRSHEPAPSLGTAEATLTLSVFTLPRPEQWAPACRCLQGEMPRDAAARLPPLLPARSQPGSPARWAPCRPGGTSARAWRCPPTSTLQAALLTPSRVTTLRGEGGIPSTPPTGADHGSDSTWQPRRRESKTVVWLVGCPGPAQLDTGCRAGGRITPLGVFSLWGGRETSGLCNGVN